MLVSQRLLRTYQTKRQEMRRQRPITTEKNSDRYTLKAEHMGYRRFTPYGLQLDKDVINFNTEQIFNGNYTDENRSLHPATLVVTIAAFPPRTKGIVARQSSEVRCIHTTELSKFFGKKYFLVTQKLVERNLHKEKCNLKNGVVSLNIL